MVTGTLALMSWRVLMLVKSHTARIHPTRDVVFAADTMTKSTEETPQAISKHVYFIHVYASNQIFLRKGLEPVGIHAPLFLASLEELQIWHKHKEVLRWSVRTCSVSYELYIFLLCTSASRR